MSQAVGTLVNREPQPGHMDAYRRIRITTILKRLKDCAVDFEEFASGIERDVVHGGDSADPEDLRPTVHHDFEAIEKALEELRSKIDAAKIAFSESGDHKVKIGEFGAGRSANMEHKPEEASKESPASAPSQADISTKIGEKRWPLDLDEYKRYGRQLIMPEIGLSGQLKLKSSKVLIIGAGGLGCPAAAYLAGAGAGHITIVDGDVVEESNLHRQIMHTARWLGRSKAESLVNALRLINPKPTYEARTEYFAPAQAPDFKDYSIILDCTDRPSSRYLISDAAVALGIPLVSASALRTEGQIMTLNDPPAPAGDQTGGPCYRCIFPKPPPAESVQSCGEGGILGPVVGVMGVLQALETIKVLTRAADRPASPPSMLMFSGYGSPMFRSMKIRGRNGTCKACSADATLTLESLAAGSVDYATFCGALSGSMVLTSGERVTARDYARIRTQEKHILVDVREKPQFELCSMPGSINVPYSTVQRWRDEDTAITALGLDKEDRQNIYVVCRLGNDSQMTVKKLKELSITLHGNGEMFDVKGGWRAWREDVDEQWPDY